MQTFPIIFDFYRSKTLVAVIWKMVGPFYRSIHQANQLLCKRPTNIHIHAIIYCLPLPCVGVKICQTHCRLSLIKTETEIWELKRERNIYNTDNCRLCCVMRGKKSGKLWMNEWKSNGRAFQMSEREHCMHSYDSTHCVHWISPPWVEKGTLPSPVDSPIRTHFPHIYHWTHIEQFVLRSAFFIGALADKCFTSPGQFYRLSFVAGRCGSLLFALQQKYMYIANIFTSFARRHIILWPFSLAITRISDAFLPVLMIKTHFFSLFLSLFVGIYFSMWYIWACVCCVCSFVFYIFKQKLPKPTHTKKKKMYNFLAKFY